MKIYRFFEQLLLGLLKFIWKYFIYIHEMKNIIKKRHLYKNIKLSKEEKQQIDIFYKQNYGKKIPYNWHRLYQSYTGKFDYKYIPEYIFTTQLELISNKRTEILPLENKSLLETLFAGKNDAVVTPTTYILRVNGIYFNTNKDIISEDEAIKLINEKYNIAVIKITKDTNSGKDVRMLNIHNGIDQNTKQSTQEIFQLMGDNFVVQEKIKQEDSISKIYPNSINTLRIITYMTNNDCYASPIVLRIGQGGKEVDNAHAGGIFIAVSDDGKLHEHAFSEYGIKYEKHPNTKIKFKNYRINLNHDIRQIAIKLHKQIPTVKTIGWDLAINSDNKIVVIEANLHSQSTWFTQMAHGKSLFEDNTKEVLQELRK